MDTNAYQIEIHHTLNHLLSIAFTKRALQYAMRHWDDTSLRVATWLNLVKRTYQSYFQATVK